MARWEVRAVDGDGRPVAVEIAADTSAAATVKARKRGLHVVGVERAGDESAAAQVPWGWSSSGSVDRFLLEAGILLRSGLRVVTALHVLEDHGLGKRLSAIARALAEGVEGGQQLSEAMGAYPREFDRPIVYAVAAAERSGDLPEVLVRLAEDRITMADRKRRVATALINPILTLVVAFAVVWIISYFLIPKLLAIYERLDIELPAMTSLVLGVFGAVQSHLHHGLLALAGLAVLVRLARRREWSRRWWHRIVLRTPLFGRISLWSAHAVSFRMFGMLYRAGVGVLPSLEHTRDVSPNQVVADQFDVLIEGVRSGQPLARTMEDRGLFDRFVRSMTETGEVAGALEESLERIGVKFDTSLDHLFGRIEALFTPILTVLLIIVVGFVVVALYLPFVAIIQEMSR